MTHKVVDVLALALEADSLVGHQALSLSSTDFVVSYKSAAMH